MSNSSVDANQGPEVEFDSAVLQHIRCHARGSMAAEICGVLIGDFTDGVTRVGASIVGEKATEGGAHVTFTQQTWEHIYKVKDAKFAESSIVGWYHSHPGFGIFLSDYDLFIHKNFFTAPHQVAWVFDPHSDEEGCFGWVSGEIAPIQRISVLRQSTQTYRQVVEGGPDDGSIDTRLQPTKRLRLRSFAFNNWSLYVLIAVTLLVVAEGVYRYKAAHKAPPSHPSSLRETNRSPTKWKEDKKAALTSRLFSAPVNDFLAQRSQLMRSIGREVTDVRLVPIDGKENQGQSDTHIRNENYVIRYKWRCSNEDVGWMDVRYIYDNRKHKVADVPCGKFNVEQGNYRSEYEAESCEIAKKLADLLFKEN